MTNTFIFLGAIFRNRIAVSFSTEDLQVAFLFYQNFTPSFSLFYIFYIGHTCCINKIGHVVKCYENLQKKEPEAFWQTPKQMRNSQLPRLVFLSFVFRIDTKGSTDQMTESKDQSILLYKQRKPFWLRRKGRRFVIKLLP